MENITDEQLVKQYLAGDKATLEILIKRYLSQIYGFVFTYVKNEEIAEDVTQETFIKAWKNIKKFKTDKKFKAWIYTIARNTALDQLKKKQAIVFSAISNDAEENFLLNSIVDSALRPDELVELYEADNWFEATVAKLSGKYRTVVILRQQNYSYREIAEKLGEPLDTVKSRYRRALALLKSLI